MDDHAPQVDNTIVKPLHTDGPEVYRARREEFLGRLGPRAAAIVHGVPGARRNHDVEYPFRPPSDLLFLTGMREPESHAVFTPGRPARFTMFVRPRDREREVWTGRRLGLEGARATLGADEAHATDELRARLVDLLDGVEAVHYLIGDDPALDAMVTQVVAQLRAAERKGRRAPTRLVDLRETLHELRLIKDEAALAATRRACAIAGEAHALAMARARPGMYEFEVEALVDHAFRSRGADGWAYPSIVGAGANATYLHYVENASRLAPGDLLLIDAGAEVGGWASDITRTFPVGGRFSPAQRRVYEIVLSVQKRCIAATVAGATIESIHALAVRGLTEGMVELGLLSGSVDQLIADETYKRFYMHRTSHWLGLDVHDAGRYFPASAAERAAERYPARPLAPGMVITVEPGLYIAADAEGVPDELRGLGIRIEDDVLVTASGPEVLTAACPKEVADVEALTTR